MTPPLTAAGFESPSLAPAGGGAEAAYELKFLLDEGRAGEVEVWARRRLALDPHGDAALGGAYRTTSLYCDTAAFDVFHGTRGHRRHKYRLRRYGEATWAFLERKSKWGDRVEKRRSRAGEEALPLLEELFAPGDWEAAWFTEELRAAGLRPALRVAYERAAFMGATPDGPVRLTLDRHIAAAPALAWSLPELLAGEPVLTGQVIVELKFQAALPALFKGLVAALGLVPSAVSKYRHGLQACGLPPGGARA